MSRWKNPIGDTDFATMVLGRADENNCMKIEFGFDAQHLYRTNAIKNNFFFSQQQNNENYTDFGVEDFLNKTKGNFDCASDFLKKSEDYLLGEVTGIADKSTVIHEAGHLFVLQGKVTQR